ncbi:MAG: NAD(P)-dependent oxidoreductase [Gemmatimonadota bacterium]
MNVLVTGADGFVGSHLVKVMLAAGWGVTGTRLEPRTRSPLLTEGEYDAIRWVKLDLMRSESVKEATTGDYEAVVHLAAVSGSNDAGGDAGYAWAVNAGGTARLLDAIARRNSEALVLVVSSSVVYGEGAGRPHQESDLPRPLSAYAATKLGTEICAEQFARQFGLKLMVARPWPHTGPFQQRDRLMTDWLARLRHGEHAINFGDPDAVRDYLDVRDVASAYMALLTAGRPGETYNVATGRGYTFRQLFALLAEAAGVAGELVSSPQRRRGWDEQHSVGDPAKIKDETGWSPHYPLSQTLRDMVHAQTH